MKTQNHSVINPQSDFRRRAFHLKRFTALRWIIAGIFTLVLWNPKGAEAQAPLPPTPNSLTASEAVAVPEPGAIAMILGGFGTLLGLQRFRHRR